jgi:chemotaxis protein methyltransferase CheR
MSLNPAGFATLAALLKSRSGLMLGPDKAYLLETRLAGLARQAGVGDVNGLAARVAQPGQERLIADIVEAMTTNESLFFRDAKPFQHLRHEALPALIAARPPGSRIRIWCAAASTGQEPYSIAMVIAEMKQQLGSRPVEILGTDIAETALARAREAVYSQFEVQRGLPVQMLVRHFQKEGSAWRLREDIRAMVQFRQHNLLRDPRVLGSFDIVFCRNVLIYFDRPTKRMVLESILRQMPRDGLIYLGGAETVFGITDQLTPLPGGTGVFAHAPIRRPNALSMPDGAAV